MMKLKFDIEFHRLTFTSQQTNERTVFFSYLLNLKKKNLFNERRQVETIDEILLE